jgi:glycosyltransferase involved in cell wall biosynthesis
LRVLFVCSRTNGLVAPFILDQQLLLTNQGVDVELYTIESKGYLGYLKSILKLRKFIKMNNFDLIHAHYGLSGLVATFQNSLPVVITYHGSDVHQKNVYQFSKIAIKRADYNIFVSEVLKGIANHPENSSVIPCGVNFDIFKKMNKKIVREKSGLTLEKNYILFSSSFKKAIKNPQIAIGAVDQISNTEIIELKGYSRNEVAELMNAVDICLLTSKDEGSPQFIKEAAACGRWIITTDVGDIKRILHNYPCVKYILPDVGKIKIAIEEVLKNNEGCQLDDFDLSYYDNRIIVQQLINVYRTVLAK